MQMYGRSLVSASIDSAGCSPRSFQGPDVERSVASVAMSSSVGAPNFTCPVKSFDKSRAGGTLPPAPGSTCGLVVKMMPPPRGGPSLQADPNHPPEQFARLLRSPSYLH